MGKLSVSNEQSLHLIFAASLWARSTLSEGYAPTPGPPLATAVGCARMTCSVNASAQCRFIFRAKELDLGRLATALGLLRLPRMPELRGAAGAASFMPSPVNPATVKVTAPAARALPRACAGWAVRLFVQLFAGYGGASCGRSRWWAASQDGEPADTVGTGSVSDARRQRNESHSPCNLLPVAKKHLHWPLPHKAHCTLSAKCTSGHCTAFGSTRLARTQAPKPSAPCSRARSCARQFRDRAREKLRQRKLAQRAADAEAAAGVVAGGGRGAASDAQARSAGGASTSAPSHGARQARMPLWPG